MSRNQYGPKTIAGPLAMTKLRNALVRLSPDLKVELRNVRINEQLQGCSGFVTNPATGKIAYVSTDCNLDPRLGDALYRTAEHTRDYRGGLNQFSSYVELPQAIVDMLAR